MYWNTVSDHWISHKTALKRNWSKLNDEDIKYIDGKRDQLAEKIQTLYGCSADQAEKQIKIWESSLKTANEAAAFGLMLDSNHSENIDNKKGYELSKKTNESEDPNANDGRDEIIDSPYHKGF